MLWYHGSQWESLNLIDTDPRLEQWDCGQETKCNGYKFNKDSMTNDLGGDDGEWWENKSRPPHPSWKSEQTV